MRINQKNWFRGKLKRDGLCDSLPWDGEGRGFPIIPAMQDQTLLVNECFYPF